MHKMVTEPAAGTRPDRPGPILREGARCSRTPSRPPFDLTFRLFGFPVRVHPLFWLVIGPARRNCGRSSRVRAAVPAALGRVRVRVDPGPRARARRSRSGGSGRRRRSCCTAFGGLAVATRTRRGAGGGGSLIALAGPAAGFLLARGWCTAATGSSAAAGSRPTCAGRTLQLPVLDQPVLEPVQPAADLAAGRRAGVPGAVPAWPGAPAGRALRLRSCRWWWPGCCTVCGANSSADRQRAARPLPC